MVGRARWFVAFYLKWRFWNCIELRYMFSSGHVTPNFSMSLTTNLHNFKVEVSEYLPIIETLESRSCLLFQAILLVLRRISRLTSNGWLLSGSKRRPIFLLQSRLLSTVRTRRSLEWVRMLFHSSCAIWKNRHHSGSGLSGQLQGSPPCVLMTGEMLTP